MIEFIKVKEADSMLNFVKYLFFLSAVLHVYTLFGTNYASAKILTIVFGVITFICVLATLPKHNQKGKLGEGRQGFYVNDIPLAFLIPSILLFVYSFIHLLNTGGAAIYKDGVYALYIKDKLVQVLTEEEYRVKLMDAVRFFTSFIMFINFNTILSIMFSRK